MFNNIVNTQCKVVKKWKKIVWGNCYLASQHYKTIPIYLNHKSSRIKLKVHTVITTLKYNNNRFESQYLS